MANRLLSECRTRVAGWLDTTISTSGTRWTTAELDVALGGALSRGINEISKHTDMFDLETTGTTSASDGSLSLASVVPLRVKSVGLVVGNYVYEVQAKSGHRRGIEDETARSVIVTYVREYTLPTDPTKALVSVSGVAANSWLAFDDWICALAALDLARKDSEGKRIQAMTALEAQMKRDALSHCSSPAGGDWPRPQSNPMVGNLRWQWKPSTTTLYLVQEF
jgi:hypothetical protein